MHPARPVCWITWFCLSHIPCFFMNILLIFENQTVSNSSVFLFHSQRQKRSLCTNILGTRAIFSLPDCHFLHTLSYLSDTGQVNFQSKFPPNGQALWTLSVSVWAGCLALGLTLLSLNRPPVLPLLCQSPATSATGFFPLSLHTWGKGETPRARLAFKQATWLTLWRGPRFSCLLLLWHLCSRGKEAG